MGHPTRRRGSTLITPLMVIAIGGVLVALLSTAVRFARQATPEEQSAKGEARASQRLEIRGIENTFRLSPRLYSGGEPRGAEAFQALNAIGVKTIISVDGATPDVEAARKFGIRYVHLPIGYDGVPREQAVKLVQAVKTLPGPVYVHCHHGKHRGPAAAAVCGIATEGWTNERALEWMKDAGTSPDYRGLHASARDFVVPSIKELEQAGRELPERAKVAALVDLMVQVDELWDRLKSIQKAGYQAPANMPDLDPPLETLRLAEQFRELVRLPESEGRGKEFLATAEAAEKQATTLEAALRSLGDRPTAQARESAGSAFVAVSKSCTACHASYRDN